MESSEAVQRAVQDWRREHPRGPLPIALRRRIVDLAEEVGVDDARLATGVRSTTIQRWQEALSKPRRKARSPAAFVELRPEVARHASSGLQIEVTGPDGRRIRIDGVRDAAQIATIVCAAMRPADEA